tara:strand:- start:1139 stop:1405 length:267 start_codon:yes stop_codon:yes gene_type:complete
VDEVHRRERLQICIIRKVRVIFRQTAEDEISVQLTSKANGETSCAFGTQPTESVGLPYDGINLERYIEHNSNQVHMEREVVDLLPESI